MLYLYACIIASKYVHPEAQKLIVETIIKKIAERFGKYVLKQV